jgi:hypothetical protein
MYYLTILDFGSGSVDQINLSDEDNIDAWETEDFEEYLVLKGYKLGNIEWMSHSDNTINKY